MLRLEVIEIAEPTSEALDAVARYAAVSDEGQKGILAGLLKRAFDVVQRYADVALLAGRWRIIASEHSGEINVYMGGKVEGVTDSHGLPISYQQSGNRLNVSGDYAEVVFATEVAEADYVRLLPVVMRYATALYDGKESRELKSILGECL